MMNFMGVHDLLIIFMKRNRRIAGIYNAPSAIEIIVICYMRFSIKSVGLDATRRCGWVLVSLALLLSACMNTNAASSAADQVRGSQTVILSAQDFLMQLLNTVNLQTLRIQMSAINRLGFDVSQAEARAPSFVKINTNPTEHNGIVAITYSREPSLTNQHQGMLEQLIITLQPQLLCIDVAAVQTAWQSQMQAGHLTPITFGLGKLNPADSLHKDKSEQNSRGNGPIEMIVKVNAPPNRHNRASLSFDHQFHQCARNVTLTTWTENK